MQLDFYDSKGNLFTSVELEDAVFQHMEVSAALQGISVQEYILNIIRKRAQEILDDEQD